MFTKELCQSCVKKECTLSRGGQGNLVYFTFAFYRPGFIAFVVEFAEIVKVPNWKINPLPQKEVELQDGRRAYFAFQIHIQIRALFSVDPPHRNQEYNFRNQCTLAK